MKDDEVDQFFAMIEDRDFDFVGSNDSTDVPVLTYRWCRSKSVSACSPMALIELGRASMEQQGLIRIVVEKNHLRGDTKTGQRVKMTVLRVGEQNIYVLMAAGLPGTREQAKDINARLAKQIELLLTSAGQGK